MPISIWNSNIKEVYVGGQKIIMAFTGNNKVYSLYHKHWEFDDYIDISSISSNDKWHNKITVKNGNLQVKSDGKYVEGAMNYSFKKRDTITIKCQLNTTDENCCSGVERIQISNGSMWNKHKGFSWNTTLYTTYPRYKNKW